MIKIVHMGDAHLGYRQYGLQVREQDYENAVSYVVARAVQVGAQAFIWPGDIFQSPYPSARSVKFVQGCVEALAQADIQSVGIDGNHDACAGKWLHVCNIYNGPLRVGDINIDGINFMTPKLCLDKMQELVKTDGVPDVLMLHQSLGDMTAFGTEITAKWMAETLGPKGLRYVALGDLHDYQIQVIGGVTFVYPGAIEMTDLNEEWRKHFAIFDIDKDSLKSYVEDIPVRPVCRYDVSTEEDLEVMLKEIAFDNFVLPVIKVNATIVGAVERINKALGAAIPHLVERYAEDTGLQSHFEEQTWKRAEGLVDLSATVKKSYPDDSEEYQLIMQLINAPDNVDDIINVYLSNKGLTNLCQSK